MGTLNTIPRRFVSSLPAKSTPPAPAQTPVEVTLQALRGPFRSLIVWNLFWGARPYSELMRSIDGITKKALRRDLAEMERLGLVRCEVRYGANRKAEYSLTAQGETLKPLVAAMYEWGLHRLKVTGRLRNQTPGAGLRAN